MKKRKAEGYLKRGKADHKEKAPSDIQPGRKAIMKATGVDAEMKKRKAEGLKTRCGRILPLRGENTHIGKRKLRQRN
jgi:hypothetical protein